MSRQLQECQIRDKCKHWYRNTCLTKHLIEMSMEAGALELEDGNKAILDCSIRVEDIITKQE
jgi:hypothetical protein